MLFCLLDLDDLLLEDPLLEAPLEQEHKIGNAKIPTINLFMQQM
mgnify:FL=1